MRGATTNPQNRFDAQRDSFIPELADRVLAEAEDVQPDKTRYVLTHPKTILNRIVSPDIRADWGLNPYQGCEHGCVYCFARNTHNYWGYSAGQDFERVILIKRNAILLLEEALSKPSWRASPIMLSGNTDCYQPVERIEKLTRGILETCWKYRHPVGLITKNRLILRDLDLLSNLAQHNLVHVAVSITTLDESLRRTMEPRTASAKQRLEVVRQLSDADVPVRVMIAPIVPGLTDHEIMDIARAAAEAGARAIDYTIVRLNGDIGEIFSAWAHTHYPERAERILARIRDCHEGKLNDSEFGRRQRGSGNIAESIRQMIQLARLRYLPETANRAERRDDLPAYNLDLFEQFRPGQHLLF